LWIQPGKLEEGLTPQKQDERFSGQARLFTNHVLDLETHSRSDHSDSVYESTIPMIEHFALRIPALMTKVSKSTITGHIHFVRSNKQKALFRQKAVFKNRNPHNLLVSDMQVDTEKEHSVQKLCFSYNFSSLKRNYVNLVVVGLMSLDQKMTGDEVLPSSLRDDISTNFVSNPNKGEFTL